MKFNELNEDAKAVAVNDYIKGWLETHPEEIFSREDATKCCIDTDDEINYNVNGEMTTGLKDMIDEYHALEGKILDELDAKEMDECSCDDCETIDYVHNGEWKEIMTKCINCGGVVNDA